MIDLLQTGAAFLADLSSESAAVSVTITRADDEITGVAATIGRSQDLRFDDNTGIVIGHETRDYLIAAADYDFGDGPVEPQTGDIITDSSSGKAIEYVVRPTSGEDGARWSDRYGVRWRIHTKRLSEEADV